MGITFRKHGSWFHCRLLWLVHPYMLAALPLYSFASVWLSQGIWVPLGRTCIRCSAAGMDGLFRGSSSLPGLKCTSAHVRYAGGFHPNTAAVWYSLCLLAFVCMLTDSTDLPWRLQSHAVNRDTQTWSPSPLAELYVWVLYIGKITSRRLASFHMSRAITMAPTAPAGQRI